MHGAKPHAIFMFSFKLLLSPQFLPKHLLAASSLLQQSEQEKAQRKTLHKQSSCLQSQVSDWRVCSLTPPSTNKPVAGSMGI